MILFVVYPPGDVCPLDFSPILSSSHFVCLWVSTFEAMVATSKRAATVESFKVLCGASIYRQSLKIIKDTIFSNIDMCFGFAVSSRLWMFCEEQMNCKLKDTMFCTVRLVSKRCFYRNTT